LGPATAFFRVASERGAALAASGFAGLPFGRLDVVRGGFGFRILDELLGELRCEVDDPASDRFLACSRNLIVLSMTAALLRRIDPLSPAAAGRRGR